MKLLRNFIKEHYYSIIFFTVILIYNFVVVGAFKPWMVGGELYSFHLVDFSMGFCSRFLPGAVYNFFFDNTSVEAISLYCVILFIIFVAFIAFLLERLVKAVNIDNRNTLLFILTFFVFGTFTFSNYVYRLGSIDFYWLSLAAFSVFCLSNKILYILLIPASILSVMSNYGSLVCFVPLIIFITLYKITTISDKKERNFLSVVLCVLTVSSYALGFYFLMFEHNNLTYTLDEFTSILNERGFTQFPEYFAMSLYESDLYDSLMGYEINEELIIGTQSPTLSAIVVVFYRILATISFVRFEKGIASFLLALPVVVLILIYFRRKSKATTNKLRKITFFCMSVMFFATIVSSWFLSIDVARFVSHSYTSLFVSLLFVIYNEKGNDLKLVFQYLNRIPKWITALYTFCFLFMIFDPCG